MRLHDVRYGGIEMHDFQIVDPGVSHRTADIRVHVQHLMIAERNCSEDPFGDEIERAEIGEKDENEEDGKQHQPLQAAAEHDAERPMEEQKQGGQRHQHIPRVIPRTHPGDQIDEPAQQDPQEQRMRGRVPVLFGEGGC